MNYELNDLLNRKIEARCGYLDEFPNKSIAKDQTYADKFFEELDPVLYLNIIDHIAVDNQVYNFWLYRNGKISKQISDFDSSAKNVIKELANLTYSNYPSVDLMYFSAIEKIYVSLNKFMLVECCVRPSLDQILILRDLKSQMLPENGEVIWKIIERKNKHTYHCGVGLEALHSFKWGKIK
jgi:hypothetical protein